MLAEIYGMTDVGKLRELNEDSFTIYGFENGSLKGVAVLADGMGGHNAGEVASRMATELILDDLKKRLEDEGEDITKDIAGAIDFANAKIYEKSLISPEQSGMGTTTVVMIVKEDLVRIANIGDSRVYYISGDKIGKITVDHSVVQQLIDSGSITEEEAKNHPDKNIITRALGTESYVDADFYEYKPKCGDSILICSDGLYEAVDEKVMCEVVNGEATAEEAVKKLINMANENGGPDNITVILLKFKSDEQEGNV